jgi:predicted ArsR family transcriptional regulator
LDGLSPHIRELIARAFDSVEAVEIVMLLRRSPETFWGAPAVAEQLGIALKTAQAKLDALHHHGIVTVGERTGAFRYAPKDDTLKAGIDDLAAAYADRRVSVINTIYSANLERLRAFSNAFRVK